MKTNKFFVKLVILTALISFAATGIACAQDQIVITGTLEQTDAGFIIKAEDGEYILELVGEQDVSKLVGKSVQALGTVSEGATGKVLIAKIVKLKPGE